MQLTTVAFTLASAALVSAQATLMINTPTSVVECQPVSLSWSGGTAPYFVSIIPGGQAGATALESFPQQSGNTYTWTADIPSGTSITFQLRDNTGAINYSDKVTIQPGTSTSCQNNAAASGGAAADSSAAPAATAAGAATSSAASGAVAAASTAVSAASRAASSAAAGASSVASRATSAASQAASSTPSSGAGKIEAGLFTVVSGALLALFA